MTIKEITDLYFSKYDKIEIVIEKWDGIKGKSCIYTKEAFYNNSNGWLNEEVISSNFSTHFTNSYTKEIKKCEYPHLYILYW